MSPHPSTTNILRYFEFRHLPDHLQDVSAPCHDLADLMVQLIPDGGAELTVGIRKLLEAMDCFVRAAVDADDS